MREIWIIGAGRFGKHALSRLFKSDDNCRLVVVDRSKEKLDQIEKNASTAIVEQDGAAFLHEHLKRSFLPEWIIPAVPVHLAAMWCLLQAETVKLKLKDIPGSLDAMLPNPIRMGPAEILVSHATFICPDNCSEPRDICTKTKKPRKKNMFDLIAGIRYTGFFPLVVRSWQLEPGVGGYRPVQLLDVADRIRSIRGNILLATACRCHGVITGLSAGF